MSTQKTIISAAAILAVTYGFSAILGLVRAYLLASYFGASEELGIFITADKIPSFVYSILVVGTLSTIFIPVFTGIFKKDEESAWHTASSMISVSVASFLVLGGIVFVFAPQIIWLLSVGKFTTQQAHLGSNLMRIMIAAQLILVISSFVTSLLQSFKYFLIPAIAPILYNAGMIAGIVFLTPKYGIYGPAYGVIIGAILHVLIQLPVLKNIGFDYTFSFDIHDKGIREIFTLMPPRVFGSALVQVSSIVNNSLAILVSTSSVVILKFADQLQSFPVSLFGASIALAALPTLSYEADEKSKEHFKETFLTSFHQMLFFVMPAGVILLVLRLPAVRLVYGASAFPWEATIMTSYTLAFFSFSVFAQSISYLINRAFYAMKDTRTPVKVNFFTILFSITLSTIFIKVFELGVWSIALSYSIAAILDVLVMLALLHKRIGGFSLDELVVPFTKISYSALFMGISLYVPLKLLDKLVFDTTKTVDLIILTGVVTIAGVISYLFFTKLFRVREIQLLYKLLRKLNIGKSAVPVEQPASESEFKG